MALRVILLMGISFFSFTYIVRSDDASVLPSQKADVVVPLIEKIKSGDDPAKIYKILGLAHVGAMEGLTPLISGAGHTQLFCNLDDGSVVNMWVWSIPGHGNGIISISLKRTNGTTEQIYSSKE